MAMTPGVCARCLVVDEDPLLRWSLVRFLEPRCREARSISSPELALAMLREWTVDFLIADARLAARDGRALLTRCRSLQPRPGIILLTGGEASAPPKDLERLGVLGLVEKPFVLDSVGQILDRALRAPGVATT